MSNVTISGPLFDGRALRAAAVMTEEIIRDVGQEAFHEVGIALDAVLKHPTGYYESQITTDRTTSGVLVHDSGVIYGPWLAGVGSRNETSRFKGYSHWLRARQRTQNRVRSIARPVVRKHVARMNRV